MRKPHALLLAIGVALIAIGTALLIPAAVRSADLPTSTCRPVAQSPNVTAITNYALPRGYTLGCGDHDGANGYTWTIQLVDTNTGQVLAMATEHGKSYGSNSLIEGHFAMCLRGNGTGRNVSTRLTLNDQGWSKTAYSPSALCVRQGGKSPDPLGFFDGAKGD